ncbi:MAG: hypothetical protein HKN23_10830 [Verrucomicrobiales bacterium]|nr:hypothetical protein [Verrucomicrobiales bacterium]
MRSSLTFDDISYAMETTQVLLEPDRRIDTFGSTNFEFHLITESMDRVDEVRIREGRIEAERPRILRPEGYEDLMFEGFGEQAEAFADWFRENGNPAFLKYGFNFAARDVVENVVHENIYSVSDRVVEDIRGKNSPMNAVLTGVDDTWEISLLKFTLEMIEKSHEINVFDFKRRGLL